MHVHNRSTNKVTGSTLAITVDASTETTTKAELDLPACTSKMPFGQGTKMVAAQFSQAVLKSSKKPASAFGKAYNEVVCSAFNPSVMCRQLAPGSGMKTTISRLFSPQVMDSIYGVDAAHAYVGAVKPSTTPIVTEKNVHTNVVGLVSGASSKRQ